MSELNNQAQSVRDWPYRCRVCAVDLYGPREIDEGRGDICMTCRIDEVRAELLHIIDSLRLEMGL